MDGLNKYPKKLEFLQNLTDNSVKKYLYYSIISFFLFIVLMIFSFMYCGGLFNNTSKQISKIIRQTSTTSVDDTTTSISDTTTNINDIRAKRLFETNDSIDKTNIKGLYYPNREREINICKLSILILVALLFISLFIYFMSLLHIHKNRKRKMEVILYISKLLDKKQEKIYIEKYLKSIIDDNK